MIDFEIVEFDKDYGAITRRTRMKFASKEEARKYCDEKDWAGHSYHAIEVSKIQDPPEIDGYPVLR